MNSRPLQIAFTALTLSLVVSMSLWVVHASHEQLGTSNVVTLQVPSLPAESRGENRPPDPFAEPFTNDSSESISGQLSPRGLETATVSKQTVNPIAENTADQDRPIKTAQTSEEPLQLPAIDLTNPPSDNQLTSKPAPPADQLDAPDTKETEPPAWLSVQATLEEEIEQLRQQQQQLNKALSRENEEAELWKSQSSELTKDLESSKEEIVRLQESLQSLKSETESLKSSLSAKTEKQEASETDPQPEPDTKAAQEPPASEDSPFVLPKQTTPTQQEESVPEFSNLLAPPVPKNSDTIQNAESPSEKEPPTLVDQDQTNKNNPTFEEAPRRTAELPTDEIVPELTGKTPPPPLPSEVTAERIPEQALENQSMAPVEPQYTESVESPYFEPIMTTPPAEPVKKKRGLIYDMQDWFKTFHDHDDSCSDCESICTESDPCTDAECTACVQVNEPTCGCPLCSASHQWVHEEEMISYNVTPDEPKERGLIPQMKRWWDHHKQKRDVRYEPAIVGRPANASVLPAAHTE